MDAPKQFTYEFNVYRGLPGKLTKLDVAEVARYRDGGTTFIRLKDGSKIYVPSPFMKNVDSTFTSPRGDAQKLISYPTTPESLASHSIDQANPLKAKAVAMTEAQKVEAAEVIKTISANEDELKSNPLEARDVQVDQAFRDQDGSLIVRFRYGARSIGTNMTFWGPKRDGKLYQLQETGFAGSMAEYKLTFLAPTEADAERTAEIQVEKSGKMTVSCDGGSRCFIKMSEGEERAVEASLKAGIVGLEGLPSVRRIEYLFKIEGTEIYGSSDFLVPREGVVRVSRSRRV